MIEKLQRQRTRFRLALPVRIWSRRMDARRTASAATAQSPIQHTFTQNISTTGCYFPLPKRLPVGSKIEMEIDIPSAVTPRQVKLRCQGKVVRVEKGPKPGRVGIGCRIERYRLLPRWSRGVRRGTVSLNETPAT